jgi:predicted dinucleotide-binding enzyme
MSALAPEEQRLGIVGAGKLGTAIARAAITAGFHVAISGSGPATGIALIVEVLAPGALAMSTPEVVAHADLIVLAVPMHRFRELGRDLFAGKTVIDTMNYWEDVDGIDEEISAAPAGTSVAVQQWFSSARVVKSLNQLGYHEFEDGTRDPTGMAVAGDDPAAVATVMRFVEQIGFDPVSVGPLAAGASLERNRHSGPDPVGRT